MLMRQVIVTLVFCLIAGGCGTSDQTLSLASEPLQIGPTATEQGSVNNAALAASQSVDVPSPTGGEARRNVSRPRIVVETPMSLASPEPPATIERTVPVNPTTQTMPTDEATKTATVGSLERANQVYEAAARERAEQWRQVLKRQALERTPAAAVRRVCASPTC